MCYMVLKNAGLLPPELELRKEISTLEAMLKTINDEKILEDTISMLNEKILRLNILEKHSLPNEKKQYYLAALKKKLGGKPMSGSSRVRR